MIKGLLTSGRIELLAPRIFVAVGTQLPFDRLVRTIDEWAGKERRTGIFAQIANSSFVPKHMEFSAFITPKEFRQRTEEADVVIAHAGMGTIITALELGKPVLVMPRVAKLGEHRNDHQFASARAFQNHGRIVVAWDETELREQLRTIDQLVGAGERLAKEADPTLVNTIRDFLDGKRDPKSLTYSEMDPKPKR
jgi:UDP-N-acetylglucosamine transferase subunit ALG13